MGYGKETLLKATQILEGRRNKAQQVQRTHHTEIINKIPEIATYEAKLAETGLAVVKAFGMGKDAQSYIEKLASINTELQNIIRRTLKANGYPEDYLETHYSCSNCEDTGFREGYICECRAKLLKDIAKTELAAVSQSAKCTFESFNVDYYPLPADESTGVSAKKRMSEILEYCKNYAEDFGPESDSLYLHGATGLGKTHLSLAIANVVAENGFKVIYDTAQNILSSLEREKFSHGNNGEREKEILDCDLLIIDDLGSEFSTQFTVAAVYNIINTRLNRSKPVIISTNLTKNELEVKYTQRVTSRIIGGYVSLLFLGKDIRQIKNRF